MMKAKSIIIFGAIIAVAISALTVTVMAVPADTSVSDEKRKLNQEFFNAAKKGDLEKVKQLLEKGADLNANDTDYIIEGATVLIMASREGHLEIVKFLIEKGADVNAVAANGELEWTALMISLFREHLEIVKFLIDNGADVNSEISFDGKKDGVTALMSASSIGNLDIVKSLVVKGADINAVATVGNAEGETALMNASMQGQLGVVKFLVENGADVNAIVAYKSRSDADTALTLASRQGHSDIEKFLIENGADINAVNQKRKTLQGSDTESVDTEILVKFEPEQVKGNYKPEYRFVEKTTGLKKKRIDLGGDITMEFVYIPAGEFLMGSPPDANQNILNYDERPQHRVKISKGFWMGVYEVTNGQYQQFVKESNYDGVRESNANYLRHLKNSGQQAGSEYPVCWISWNNARAFCEWLSAKEGKTYRLPTEAQWEYACRANSKEPLNIKDDGLFLQSSGGRASSMRSTHPAGQNQPNSFGLYDMYDNVKEWCQDWYGFYSNAAEIDPQGLKFGDKRAVRGDYSGNIISYSYTERSSRLPGEPSREIGFRVVCEDSE
ncbi:MAG: SUMF1/EgtB/PvdO family nonheme iron enzyme [Sedimentisphaerales bacterium]|nr:SUMF1/EgtB/PvdO family nonheme iron enzyme [Sedimentisphaerales bacterium]